MSQQQFVERYQGQWDTLERLLAAPRGTRHKDPTALATLPHLYRQVCHHLALARDRGYAYEVVERLNRLVVRGHQSLYEAQAGTWARMLRFAVGGFPASVREEWRVVVVSTATLMLPLLTMLVAVRLYPELIYSFMDAGDITRFEDMYDPGSEHFGRERDSDSDLAAFGFYVRNNTGIGFRTFAGGLLFGVGSLFILVFNGLFIGAVAGHLGNLGFGQNLYSFMSGHAPFELTAIVLCGAAGIRLGLALLAPGRRRRSAAIREAAKGAMSLVYGAAGLFVLAAFVEAYWSSKVAIDPGVKYAVGAVLWILVLAYFVLPGRRRAP